SRQLESGVEVRYALRVTDPARTVAELLRGMDLAAQLWLLDQALRSGVTREAVRAALPVRGPGRAAHARMLLALGDARSESPLESAVALALAVGGAPAADRQLVVRDDGGRFLARVDFAWPAERVLLEADGFAYHTAPAALAQDRHRQNALVNAGWRPLRTTWAQAVHAPESLVREVRAALSLRT
ncbi:MAG: endonuclease domain-containing protein, partial [Mycobacteriales bacterium]